ncbi:MAG: hypothetical protein IJ920_07665, partial [Paludibacteraceae bacterium]|nr:hypothetical protein [Paludibacteraceae bacterium]
HGELLEAEDEFAFALWPGLHDAVEEMNKELGQCEDDDKYRFALGAKFKIVYNLVDLAYEKAHPDYKSPTRLFGDKTVIMQRAYCDHVGKQVYPTFDPSIKVQPSAPEESVKGWYSLYRRSDCSANQESIYNDAIPYAEQGDPDAMLVVGYLLSHGIRTQYDYPRVDILLENKERALPFLQAAADYGLVDAYWETAAILFGRKDAESEALGWKYVEKGAEENEKECLRCLFDHYEGKDDTKAFGYLERLSEAWNTHEYTLKLARWCETGRGCEKNEKKAFELAEYVWSHSSASPYDSSQEDSVDLLCRYLRNGIGCEKDPERAGQIYRWYKDDEDRMWEMLTR